MKIAAVIGSPVAQSLSPAIHNASFRSRGDDWAFGSFPVAPGRVPDALRAMRELQIAGLAVTMPHKDAAYSAVDAMHESAQVCRSVNTVIVASDGDLLGANTDGDGCCNALEAAGAMLGGARIVVIGAGGTARAIVVAATRRGARDIVIINRSLRRASDAAAISSVARVGDPSEISQAGIVINTTPVGLGALDHSETPIDVNMLRSQQIVLDAVYYPLQTPLLRAAQSCGAIAVDGLSMLVHQAALQQQFWLGRLPDLAIMRQAALNEIEARRVRRSPIA